MIFSNIKHLLSILRRKCGTAVRLIYDGRIRSEWLYKKIKSRSHHQISTLTLNDRYPELFSECSKYFLKFQTNPSPKILSFGCSSGEEVFTLARYMPSAIIIGVDSNKWCINQCNKKRTDQNRFFYHRESKSFEESKDFDAIFCMAVFQRTENRMNNDNSFASIYPFSKFEKEILILHQKLKVGGLLIIEESDFSFIDTRCADHYKPLPFVNDQILKERPLFDKNNRKIAETQFVYRIFIKIR